MLAANEIHLCSTEYANQLWLPVAIECPKTIYGVAMVNSGASANFINKSFMEKYKILKTKKKNKKRIKVIDGRDIADRVIECKCLVKMYINEHVEEIFLDVTSLGWHDLVLGIPWLKSHNPKIDWPTGVLDFDSDHCIQECIRDVPRDLGSLEGGVEVQIPKEYANFQDVFEQKNADKLPLHQPYDLEIKLQPGKLPQMGHVYSLSREEEVEAKKWIDENLSKGFIRESDSQVGSPIMFMKKKDGSNRLCVDYWALNAVTIQNRYPLPRTDNLIETIKGARIFTKLDLKSGYNLVHVKEEDVWKTTFRTKWGLFETLVMPFGLTNVPAAFQHFMNDIFRDILGVYVVIYLDDILIFSASQEEHQDHVKEVLRRLQENKLYCSLNKCSFHVPEVEYLGLIVSGSKLSMDNEKIRTIKEWSTPKNVTDVQTFLGFANFYRRFIDGYTRIARPLYNLTQKNQPWTWEEKEENAFQHMIQEFQKAPTLLQPNLDKGFIMEYDAWDRAIGAVLSQEGDDGKLHLVAFMLKSLSPAERNNDIYDKELLAVIRVFKEWRHLLEGREILVLLMTDHKNLEYFMTTKVLTKWQNRWAVFLSEFNFLIKYRAGGLNRKADALSRRSDHNLEGGVETTPKPLLDLRIFINAMMEVDIDGIASEQELDNLIAKQDLMEDPYVKPIWVFLRSNPEKAPAAVQKEFQDWQMEGGLLLWRQLIYVPNNPDIKRQILELYHDSKVAGHMGHAKTLELTKRHYWWPSMKAYVGQYIDGCDTSQRSKPINQKLLGTSQPLELPKGPQQHISVDMIVKLPQGHNSILVVVNTLTMQAHFIPTTEKITSPKLAELFLAHVWELYGTPEMVISDRGAVFASKFMKGVYDVLGIRMWLSTAYHPQMDGQTERVNQTVEGYLRTYCLLRQHDWAKLLPMAEFAYNNSHHSSIGMSPFFANHGRNPTLTGTPEKASPAPEAKEQSKTILAAQKEALAALTLAKERDKVYFDRKHDEAKIGVGDIVWLSHEHIGTNRPSIKLSHKHLGPFEVEAEIGRNAFQLKLPSSIKVHPVFHASRLVLWKPDQIPGRTSEPPPPITTPKEKRNTR
jgi:hypothetical protein